MMDSFSEPDEIEEYAGELEKEFEEGRKQGALEELKQLRVIVESVDYQIIKEHIDKRIKELEGDGVEK